MTRPIRIANCSGFYGDRLSAAREQLEGGEIDVLTGDWLAELTMLILAMDQMGDPSRGYARTFLKQAEAVMPGALERGVRIVSNAGGLNPHGLAAAVGEIAKRQGISPRIAVVTGDDLRAAVLDGLPLTHRDTGVIFGPEHGRAMAANAYLGCWGIARALDLGADIVITGRVTDAAVVLGPAAWHHHWRNDAWDALSGALAAAHVIECGCQATGGNFSFWDEIDLERAPGFPIAEIARDGTSVITKHPETGGAVTVETVTAQLLYEIGGPDYLSPDVIGHFDTLQLEQEGIDRVKISHAVGSPPPPTLKLGVAVAAGFRNELTALFTGWDAPLKAVALEKAAWRALGGKENFEDARADFFPGPLEPTSPTSLSFLRFAVRDRDAKKVATRFTAPLVELALSHVPGLTFTSAPGKPKPVGIFWPVDLAREHVEVAVHLEGEVHEVPHPPTGPLRHESTTSRFPPAAEEPSTVRVLGDLCGARSGDKGGNANVGFWVRNPENYSWMCRILTEDRIAAWLEGTGFAGQIERYEFANLHALNFVLKGWLGEGVAANLAPDPQAKSLAEFFRTRRVPFDTVGARG